MRDINDLPLKVYAFFADFPSAVMSLLNYSRSFDISSHRGFADET